MPRKRKGDRWIGVLAGPSILMMAIVVLWKNETRYDYYRAAVRTTELSDLGEAKDGQLVSFTGPVDKQLTVPATHVEPFVGYLMVDRTAEIYAWDRKKDDDGNVTWSRRWMSSVEDNSRNKGIHQRLSSNRLLAEEYRVGDLLVGRSSLQFVDAKHRIDVQRLQRLEGWNMLSADPPHLVWKKGKSDGLGDERISYKGIPVQETSTYFGKFVSNRGQAHEAEKRSGMISTLIADSGILHHVVGGDRSEALTTMWTHIARIKWIVRSAGGVVAIVGCWVLFASLVGFLFAIPIIGSVAEWGAFALAVLVGGGVSIVVMIVGYFASHPVPLVVILASVCAAIYLTRRRGASIQRSIKAELDAEYGHELSPDELKELEFVELAQLALSDSSMSGAEQTFLHSWGRHHGWTPQHTEELLERASAQGASTGSSITSEGHLENLIKIALSDGRLTPYEMRTIRKTAKSLGHDRKALRQIIGRVRKSAKSRS